MDPGRGDEFSSLVDYTTYGLDLHRGKLVASHWGKTQACGKKMMDTRRQDSKNRLESVNPRKQPLYLDICFTCYP